ncbi:MAG TPA: phosphate acyltransferase [Smithellaceae bacterium]|nr:phosphate acyltransferase [Smithellaceae bacterium]
MLKSFRDVLEADKEGGTKKLAISSAEKKDIDLLGKAAAAGLVMPCLIGDGKVMEGMIKGTPLASLEHEIMNEKKPDKALSMAIGLIREGRADMLMQGAVKQQMLLDAVMDVKKGLRQGKLASCVSVFGLPKPEKLIFVTDTFINNRPNLAEKQLILEHAVRLAGVLEIEAPKIAALAAIEQINLSIPSTLDAAILSKMSERRQFGNAIVEGPLDIDCALSKTAAERKGLQSVVTGDVDIYLAPEIDTGLLLAEALVFFGKMRTVGAIMGTANPVILNLPFVREEDRMVEIAIAVLVCKKGKNDA